MNFDSAISTPIISSAAFSYENSAEAEAIFSGNCPKPLYARMGNPTTATLEESITKLENGVGAIGTSSGMGAISMVIMALTKSNDEIISIGGLFGGSYALMSQTLPRYGIKTHFVDVDNLDSIETLINDNTKVLFCESVGNPSLRLVDMKKLGEVAAKYGIIFIVDNTITPLIVKPFSYGADIVVYSTTKIISGNSSALGGIAVFNSLKRSIPQSKRYEFLKPFIDKLEQKALVGCCKKRALRDFGMSANAHSSYQTLLGLETLGLRTERVNTSVKKIAHFLKENGINVNHPSLEDSIDHEFYKEQYKNGCGSMVTLDLGTKEKAFKFLDASELLTLTANIGDSRTLGLHMASTIYRDFTEDEKKFLGISDGLVRLSIGLEDPELICSDIVDAFKLLK